MCATVPSAVQAFTTKEVGFISIPPAGAIMSFCIPMSYPTRGRVFLCVFGESSNSYRCAGKLFWGTQNVGEGGLECAFSVSAFFLGGANADWGIQ